MKPLTIDETGTLHLPTLIRRDLAGKSLSLLSSSPNHLLLGESGGSRKVILSGCLGDLSVPDLISFFNMFRREGLLHFDLPGGRKSLWFQSGEIVFATSSFPEEDLGEVLLATGKINAETLKICRQEVATGRSIGKVLLDKRVVNKQDLWVAARQQAEQIVYNLFAEDAGSFYYRNANLEGLDKVRLSMSTQNLLMEGLRRMDERTLFMRRIGSLDARIQVQAKSDGELHTLSDELAAVYALAQKKDMSVRELVRALGVGDFEGLRLIYQLVEQGFFQVEEVEVSAVEGALANLLEIFNGTLAALFSRISPQRPGFRAEVMSFIRDIPQPYSFVLRDVGLKDDGTLDANHVVDNLKGLSEYDQKSMLADALSELLYMECMIAQQVLQPETAQKFIQRVQEITRRVREIVGRRT